MNLKNVENVETCMADKNVILSDHCLKVEVFNIIEIHMLNDACHDYKSGRYLHTVLLGQPFWL